ncbi:MAG: type IV secretion system DNA-binding domain-containing protein [Candidatus Abawacabacteria bacterium]|nr:type IV secretion system DNA-binding domain-containing protein [Candidatus Abawacabacteria bacterium]
MNSSLTSVLIGIVVTYSLWKICLWFLAKRRAEKNAERAKQLQYYLVTIPKADPNNKPGDHKEVIAIMEQVLTAMNKTQKSRWKAYFNDDDYFGFELSAKNFKSNPDGCQIDFFIIALPEYLSLIQKQITAFYPDANIELVKREDQTIFTEGKEHHGATLKLGKNWIFPIRTFRNLSADPMNSLINPLAQLEIDEGSAIQLLLMPADKKWTDKSLKAVGKIRDGKSLEVNKFLKPLIKIGELVQSIFSKDDKKEKHTPTDVEQEQIKLVNEKARKVGFKCVIRVVSSSATEEKARAHVETLISSFGQYNDPATNEFIVYEKIPSDKTIKGYKAISIGSSDKLAILNTEEIASIFHFPNSHINTTPSIHWQNFRIAAAPAVLAKEGVLIGYNVYRGNSREVYMNFEDRFRHLYIIGQTGMGKSVLQKALVKQDMKAGHGLCVVDPHGELVDDCMEWIPPERIQDVIVFDPSDTKYPVGINMLEAKTPEEKDFIALDAMNMMIGLFGPEIFGPRIQDYFRNGCLTLMDDEEEGGALTDIVRLFTDEKWQQYKVSKVKNPIVKSFWTKQMAATGAREKEEMIPFLAAKFGAFVTNTTMRNIVGQTKSSFDFSEAMNSKKIIFVKLAKGLIGDINANLLGMIFVNKMQVAAMRRAGIAKSERQPFFLYVDEFQNFVTDAFESILSEARKYRLGLIVAHQYIAQLVKNNNDKVKNAVFGNVGTMLNFKIGAQDAEYMEKEMGPVFSANDLINLRGFNACIKMSIANIISPPFSLNTVKDFDKGNKEITKVATEMSRLRYGRDVRFVGPEILSRIGDVDFSNVA